MHASPPYSQTTHLTRTLYTLPSRASHANQSIPIDTPSKPPQQPGCSSRLIVTQPGKTPIPIAGNLAFANSCPDIPPPSLHPQRRHRHSLALQSVTANPYLGYRGPYQHPQTDINP
ncbi:hypothetical protein M440DRAFT_1251311 [Trichoderma longibrachiatum ATCC 18648]|uniref:Uncharacterized protein n=1 Tax=Trichoderma longibrachiatum ATCC 18648 TaxID=983965 RepID=A0A2T4C492_TRILO|nr:hypothetical protein M440DRAFT_1251311 [Trichoderma longibrachiatum ATCC 18648]